MGPHDERTRTDRYEVDHDVFQRMAVDRDDSNWCSPLMVGLVDMLVEQSMVAEPERED